MIKPVSRLVAVRARVSSLVRFTGCAGLGIALLASVAATPPPGTTQGPDEQYIHIMAIIDRADALSKAGQADAARAKYLEAEKALLYFKSANPLFDPKTVAYRLKEVSDLADVRPVIPESTNSAARSNLEAPAPAPKTNVKLLEAGAEPRSVLRYHVKAGDKQMALLTMKLKLDVPTPMAAQGAAPQQAPNIPAISVPVDISVLSVTPSGDITCQAVLGDLTLAQDTNTPPEMAQTLQTALAGIKGTTITTVMSDRGLSKKSDMKVATGASPQARQFADQIKEGGAAMSIELPEEAVGVGAKWEAKQQTKVQNATVEQTGTYELTALDGDKMAAKFSAEAAGKTAAAGISGSVSGTGKVDLSKAAPVSVEINQHMELPGPQKGQVVKMDMTMTIDSQ